MKCYDTCLNLFFPLFSFILPSRLSVQCDGDVCGGVPYRRGGLRVIRTGSTPGVDFPLLVQFTVK